MSLGKTHQACKPSNILRLLLRGVQARVIARCHRL